MNLSIKTTDENGRPIPSNLSMAVVDDKLWSFADDKQDHILSWLLLGSELQGKIEEPQFYFRKEEAKADAALDLLMLTQGYRYFDLIADIEQKGLLKFAPQQANTLSGVIVDTDKKPVPANVYLVNTIYGGNAIRFRTGSDGVFYFSELMSNTDYHVFDQPVDKKSKVSIQDIKQGDVLEAYERIPVVRRIAPVQSSREASRLGGR